MPFIDGFEATEQIRTILWNKKLPQPIVTAVTGQTEQKFLDKCLKSGINQVVSKPVDVNLMKNLLERTGYL